VILVNLEQIDMSFKNMVSIPTMKASKDVCHFKIFHNRLQILIFKSIKLRILNATGLSTGNFLQLYSGNFKVRTRLRYRQN
jgi:hypothetical protein